MDKADSCRRAASDAVADVEPPRLSELVDAVLDEASMVPGALTIESAATHAQGISSAFDDSAADRTDDVDSEALLTHAAGVQLIYEGLRLTRDLAHAEPWTADDETGSDRTDEAPAPTPAHAAIDAPTESDAHTADLAILAADILVARGFYLLAHTDAADKAVRTVQAFGRDQTRRTELASAAAPATAAPGSGAAFDSTGAGADADADADTDTSTNPDTDTTPIDIALERDILELAVRTGAAAVGESPTPRALELAETLIASLSDTAPPPFPPVADCLSGLEPSPPDRSLEKCTPDHVTPATDP